MGVWLFMAGGGAVALGGVLVVAWALGWDRARGRVRCPKCWYDMRGVPAGEGGGWLCPECGGRIARERGLRRTRRRWRWAGVGLLAAVAGVVLFDYPNLRGGGWQQRLPTTVLILLLPHVDDYWTSEPDTLSLRLNGNDQPGVGVQRALPRWQRGLLANRAIAAARNGRPRGGGLSMLIGYADDPRPLISALLELATSEDQAARWWAVSCLYCFRHDMEPDQLAEAIALLGTPDDFLGHNAAVLARLAETGDDRQRDWLRSLIGKCTPSVERAAVEEALAARGE
ncbi:MAG: HEAT repeat domain-containing protein [Phycisphaeraceae bacterium]|nr:HEAT repeat domain-containing protein [Phycisphaeraceae bacterium]